VRAAPKIAPTLAPLYVSDRTSELVLGVEWRSLKAWCTERDVPIHRIGRRPVVAVDAIRCALEGGAGLTEVPYDENSVIARAAGVRS
jgi:hypothetical protein